MIADDIKTKAETFFEWPSEKRLAVSYTSALLFAQDVRADTLEQIADLVLEERGKCVTDAAAEALADIIRSYKP